jgi:hypothetical protein
MSLGWNTALICHVKEPELYVWYLLISYIFKTAISNLYIHFQCVPIFQCSHTQILIKYFLAHKIVHGTAPSQYRTYAFPSAGSLHHLHHVLYSLYYSIKPLTVLPCITASPAFKRHSSGSGRSHCLCLCLSPSLLIFPNIHNTFYRPYITSTFP